MSVISNLYNSPYARLKFDSDPDRQVTGGVDDSAVAREGHEVALAPPAPDPLTRMEALDLIKKALRTLIDESLLRSPLTTEDIARLTEEQEIRVESNDAEYNQIALDSLDLAYLEMALTTALESRFSLPEDSLFGRMKDVENGILNFSTGPNNAYGDTDVSYLIDRLTLTESVVREKLGID